MLIRQYEGINEKILELEGDIDEDAFFPVFENIASSIKMDLDKVSHLNSCGIREWIKWIKPLSQSVIFTFKNCPKIVIDQINTVDGFMPSGAVIESFKVPYFCSNCENLNMPVFQTKDVVQGVDLSLPATVNCENCQTQAEMDVIPERYFKFLLGKSK